MKHRKSRTKPNGGQQKRYSLQTGASGGPERSRESERNGIASAAACVDWQHCNTQSQKEKREVVVVVVVVVVEKEKEKEEEEGDEEEEGKKKKTEKDGEIGAAETERRA